MFDWSKITSTTAVHCTTEEEAKKFLAECKMHGLKWANPDKSMDKTSWGEYRENTVYYPIPTLMYGSIGGIACEDCTVLEFTDLCEPALPRICSVLCPENPLKVGEHFKIQGYVPEFWIDEYGHFAFDGVGFLQFALTAFSEAINHPEKIIRRPQFSDDEKALFKAFHALGYDYWLRNGNGLFAASTKPIPRGNQYDFDAEAKVWCLPSDALPHLTLGNTFDAAAYLESEAAK